MLQNCELTDLYKNFSSLKRFSVFIGRLRVFFDKEYEKKIKELEILLNCIHKIDVTKEY